MFSWIVISVAFCTALTTKTDYKCPYGYTLNEMDRMCIKIHVQPRMKYDDAREVCKKKENGDLVQPQNIASNRFIAGLLTKRKRYWIGIKTTPKGEMSYVNGSLLSFDAPWACGEPNNHRGSESCVEMIAKTPGSWNDKRCTKKRPFVCQTNFDPNSHVYDLISCDFETPCNYTTYDSASEKEILTNHSVIVDNTNGTSTGNILLNVGVHNPIFLLRPIINITQESCLSFLFQGRRGELMRFIDSVTDGPPKVLVGVEVSSGPEQMQWNELYITIQPEQNVIFGFMAYDNYDQGVTAKMDDIKFRPKACGTVEDMDI